MERSPVCLSPAAIVLVAVLLLYVALWLACPQGFVASDPWIYSRIAFAIAQDGGFGESSVFSHRLGTTVPVALAYSLFGVSIASSNLWPLCATLIVVAVVWMALPDPRSKIVGALLCLVSVPLFRASVALYPDIVATAFMALSSLVLFHRRDVVYRAATWLLAPSLAVLLLFFAFLAKESAYWVLPLWAIALAGDLNAGDRAILLQRFYRPALIVGVLLGSAYLLVCFALWGDPLARFHSIESLTGQHLWSWGNAPADGMLKRLTIAPARLLVDQYGVILALAPVGFVIAPAALRPWGYYTACCLFFFWFGTTSFSRYEPLPLMDRMSLPILPGLYVLAAFAVARLALVSQRAQRIGSVLPIVLMLVLAGFPFLQYLGSWRWMQFPEAEAMSIVKREVAGNPDRRFLLVCADRRSPDALAFYFGYRYPDNLEVAFAGDLSPALLNGRVPLAFIDTQRSQFLKSAYGSAHYDSEIRALGLASIYSSGPVALLRSVRPGQFAQMIAGSDDRQRSPR